MKKLFEFIKKHFKTLAFIFGFVPDFFLLPKTTHKLFPWIWPLDIAVVLILIIIRQTIKRTITKKDKRIKKEMRNDKEKEKKSFDERKGKWHIFLGKLNIWATFAVSFFLGTLLSHIFVYYFRSSNILQMWPVFLIVFATILSNEFFSAIIPDIVLFFIGVVFYFIFMVPVALNRVNDITFLISLLISAIVTLILTVVLQRIYLSRKEFISLIIFSIVFPFLLLRLYFINYIPAVPLALGNSGFYSYVVKIGGAQGGLDYKKEEEGIKNTKKLFLFEKSYFDSSKSGELYFFSSIISPADVTAEISHVWERYDDENKAWIKKSEVSYEVAGGREDGYRGYSVYSGVTKGKWRVRVLADGRLVGLKEIMVN